MSRGAERRPATARAVITDRTLKVRYIAGIPRSAGSAALSHLRLAGIAALGVAVVTALSALALSLLDDDRPAGRASDQIEGVVTFDVALEGDFSRPPSGPTLAGQVVDVPEGGKTVVLAAPPDHEYQIRFRSGQRWGPWVTVEAGGDDGPDGPAATDGSGPAPSAEGPPPGVVAIGPLLVDGGADRLEVVRSRGDQGDVELTFLLEGYRSPGGDDGRPQVAGQQVEAGSAVPVIMPRSAWTSEGWATGNAGCSDGPWYADNVQALVVHHTVNSNSYQPSDVDDLLRAIHYAHVRVNGWCDVGYNFIVDRFGTIWEARVGGIDRPVIGGHAKGFNTSTVGVALLGQHQVGATPAAVRPTSATATALTQLAAWKLDRHGVDPAGNTWLQNRSTSGPQRLTGGQWHLVPTVVGHRDLGLTACPGTYGLDLARGLVPELVDRRQTQPPYRFEGWVPAGSGPGLVTVDRRGGLRPAGSVAVAGIGAGDGPSGPDALPSPQPVALAANRDGAVASGYVLHADGVLHPFGTAPAIAGRPAGEGAAVDVALAAGGAGGWVVSAAGGVHGFGGQADRPVGGSVGGIVAGAVDGAGDGYLVDAAGRLWPVGQAIDRQLAGGPVEAVDVALRGPLGGGWVLDSGGRLHPFGGAPAASIGGRARPAAARAFRAAAGSLSGHGGWVLTDDGQLWPFGDAELVLPVATDATAADIADLAVVARAVSPAVLSSDTARYVNAAFELFLGRPATADEVAYWYDRLGRGGGRQPLTLELARSDEWAGARIEAMYADVLGRPADQEGRQFWVERVRAGMPLRDVGAVFYGSSEYYLAAPSPADYVTRLYQALLGRDPDAGGLRYWTGELESGRAKPVDIAAGFYASPESRRRRVAALYQSVLGRPPEAGGSSYWAQRLLETDDVVLAAELAASDEFHAMAVG